jgi:hypothetical protein
VKPIFVGLGAAAVLAAGGASASADDTTSPAPSDSASASPSPAPKLTVVASVESPANAGTNALVTTRASTTTGTAEAVHVVSVTLSTSNKAAKASFTEGCRPPSTVKLCDFGNVGTDPKTVTTSVFVPKSLPKSMIVTVTVTVAGTADGKDLTGSDTAAVTYRPLKTSAPPTTSKPTKSPSKSPSPSKSATPSASASGGGHGSSSGGGSGSGSSGGTSGTTGGSGTTSGSGYVPPEPNSSFQAKNPQVALPPIAAPSPSIAPNTVSVTPESRLRGNKAPVAQDLTFERVASTQVAWLAALMVAIAVLLTQLRLGKRRAPAGAAAAAMRRAKGMHRRTRRGMFGK